MILGIGTDLVEMELFRKILADGYTGFVESHFTEREIKYCTMHEGHDPVLHYAGRYAAKEAFIKARGPWYRDNPPQMKNLNYREIEILTNDLSGPEIVVHGKIKSACEKAGVKKIFVSISHEKNTAVAFVLLEG